MDMDEAMEKSVYIAGVTPVDDDFDLKDFTHIRAYHSCRPISIDSYKKQGICPLTYESAKSDLLLKLQNAGIPEATLIEIFDKHWDDLGAVHQGVWFTLTKEELLELSGHYLIYGSEFVHGIATELRRQDALRKYGKPTIFTCDVPIEFISLHWFRSLQDDISDNRLMPCAFRISESLPPENIIAVEFPQK